MARRYPVVSLALITFVLLFLYTTSRKYHSSDTLARIQQYLPQHDPNGAPHLSQAESSRIAEDHDKEYEVDNEMESSRPESDPNAEEKSEKEEKEEKEEKGKKDKKGKKGKKGKKEKEAEAEKAEKADEEKDDYRDEETKEGDTLKENDETVSESKDSLPDTDLETSLSHLVAGAPIMEKMPNQTARAEVGHAGWKFLHTTLAQYPVEPSEEDQQTMNVFLKFFSRVYPCRECAENFQKLLQSFPPQLSSRKTAVLWGCDAHNKVNKRLGHPIFDCSTIFDLYDCGCEPDVASASASVPVPSATAAEPEVETEAEPANAKFVVKTYKTE